MAKLILSMMSHNPLEIILNKNINFFPFFLLAPNFWTVLHVKKIKICFNSAPFLVYAI